MFKITFFIVFLFFQPKVVSFLVDATNENPYTNYDNFTTKLFVLNRSLNVIVFSYYINCDNVI